MEKNINKKEYYNQFYTDRDWKNSLFITKGKIRAYLKIATSVSPKKIHRVIDAGCGTGLYSYVLKSLKYEVSGFDFSHIAIQKAKENFNTIDFRLLDGKNLNYESNIDCFLALGFSEFNTSDFKQSTALIEHWRSFLTSNGLILITSKTNLSGRSPTGWIYHSHKEILNFYSGQSMKKQIVYLYPPLWTIISFLPKSKIITRIVSNFSKLLFIKLLKWPITVILILQNDK